MFFLPQTLELSESETWERTSRHLRDTGIDPLTIHFLDHGVWEKHFPLISYNFYFQDLLSCYKSSLSLKKKKNKNQQMTIWQKPLYSQNIFISATKGDSWLLGMGRFSICSQSEDKLSPVFPQEKNIQKTNHSPVHFNNKKYPRSLCFQW